MEFFDVLNPFGYMSYTESMNEQNAIDVIYLLEDRSVTELEMDEILEERNIDFYSLPTNLQIQIANKVIE